MEYSQTYIDLMITSLKEKTDILKELITLSKKQGECIRGRRVDTPAYEEIYQQKDKLIETLSDADAGFEKLYGRVREELDQNRQTYREQIRQMQQQIQEITDLGVQLQAIELRNKDAMEQYLKGERETIRQFHHNNKASSLYYRNMSNHAYSDEAVFYDQKK